MADLSAFATKKTADEGVILPVKIDGIKVPMAIQIFGSDSDIVREYERKQIRKLTQAKKGKKDLDADDIEELLDDQDEGVLVRMGDIYSYDWKKKKIVDGEPVTLNEKTIGSDRASKAYLCEEMPAIKAWVTENSNERSNFLADGKKN